jgi:L-glyceraldehyde 3-phosphate reductase
MWPGPYGDFGSRKYLLSSLDQSLRRLGLDYVDIFYHHRPDPKTPLEETMGALDAVVRAGKALYVGISNYDHELTRRAQEVLRGLGTPCIIHQPSYSIMNRWVEPHLLGELQRQGMGCIVFSPLAQMALSWVLRQPAVTSALIGASRVSQIEECVRAVDALQFSSDELAAIDAIVAKAEPA